MAIDARMASNNDPRLSHTSRCLRTSVATAVNEIGRSSMLRSLISSLSTPMMRSPFTSPLLLNAKSSSRTTSALLRDDTQRV